MNSNVISENFAMEGKFAMVWDSNPEHCLSRTVALPTELPGWDFLITPLLVLLGSPTVEQGFGIMVVSGLKPRCR